VSETLQIDNLAFALRRSPDRTTVGITVDRDGSLVLCAPVDSPVDLIERIVRDKLAWVYAKLAQKELLLSPGRRTEFVSGEGFHYLGRSYRLALIESHPGAPTVPLRLHHGRFQLRRDERHRASEHFVAWYIGHGAPWLEYRVNLLAGRVGVAPPSIEVCDLGNRWGACRSDGSLAFHWQTVCLPPRIIEYVVAHELVHLREPHHRRTFWQRLERVMPDFATRKDWLAQHGSGYQLMPAPSTGS
jgi:predicted metal-dependent hydrolase